MKKHVLTAVMLIVLSGLFYYIHYLLFHDAHHIFIYLVGDIAFVFLEVLLVTLIIERFLHNREKKKKMQKLNMVIGAFFSEIGIKILTAFAKIDKQVEGQQTEIMGLSTTESFRSFSELIRKNNLIVDIDRMHWEALKTMLSEKRNFMVRLLENPALLEHERFTDVLWALFHLTEELESRKSLEGLPKEDYMHLAGDVHRVYSNITPQWLEYLKHLQTDYPHLFSLALRTNPFNLNSSPIVKE